MEPNELNAEIPDMHTQLHMVAAICSSLHRDELNEDVARGIAFAVGYICGVDDSQENEQ